MAIIMKKISPKLFREQPVQDALLRAMERFVHDVYEHGFVETFKTFDTKPVFERKTEKVTEGIKGTVDTDDENYRRLNEGTKKHRVPKTGIATMAFPSAYTAKTTPGDYHSHAGGPSGDVVIRTGAWIVGGIKARKFDEKIAKNWKPVLGRYGNQALKEAAKASGHGI